MSDNFEAPPGATPPGPPVPPGPPTPPGPPSGPGDEQPTEAPPPTGDVPPPPPPTGAFAARYGLIRPRQPRVLAGVSGALARATNTDPILWRVIFIALAFFAGFGVVAYLVLWLATPADGDSASPVEALFGRGRSSTSPLLTVIVGVITLLMLGGATDNWHIAVIGAIIVAVVLMASNRNRSSDPGAGAAAAYQPPTAPIGSEQPGYRPPFAPHGPYAPPTPPPPPVVAPPREHSRLGSLIFSVGLVVLGVLGVLDLGGANIPAGSYVSAALITVGVGLIVGAWIGRARGMIALGILLSLALAAVGTSGHEWTRSRSGGGDMSWHPTSVSALNDRYEHQFGNATLDLRDIDFKGQERDITVQIQAGEFTVLLPENVDVHAIASVKVGDVTLFDQNSGGIKVSDFEVTDNGADGEGGGSLRLNVVVTAGHAEVTR